MVKSLLIKYSQPLIILLVCVLAFGLQVFSMGFYIDDWVILNAFSAKGLEGLRMYSYLDSRPLVFWIWWIGFLVNGFTPALWQIWAALWRFLSVGALWMTLREIWPQYKRQVLMASLLFAVYPIFLQQATALTYSFHWICFTLFFVSLYFTVLSVKRPGKYGRYTLLAVLFGSVQLFSQEFFVGLELFRPFVIWFLQQNDSGQSIKTRLRRVTQAWLPYVVIIAAYAVWRFALMPAVGADRNAPKLFEGLGSNPLGAIVTLAQYAMQDVLNGVLGSWYKTIQPDQFALTPISSLLTLALIGLTLVMLLVTLPRIFKHNEEVVNPVSSPWYRSAIPLGFVAMVAGFAPGWAIGRQYSDPSGLFNDRFGLAAMFGAALIVTAVVEWIIQNKTHQLVIYCMLIALAVGNEFRAETNYRWSWEQQVRFAWELSWRAPQLKPPTAVFAEGTQFEYMGGFSNKAYINQIYAFNQDNPQTEYWFFDTFRTDPMPFMMGEIPIDESHNTMSYSGGKNDNLVVQFKPDQNQCLWVLSADDVTNIYITDSLKSILPLGNLDRIVDGTSTIPTQVFGQQPAPFWCYYYEKGALAAQFLRWNDALSLWKEAQQKGFKASVGIEDIPFIQAAAYTNDWQLAEDITQKANNPATQMKSSLCAVWQNISKNAPPSGDKDTAVKFVRSLLGCQ